MDATPVDDGWSRLTARDVLSDDPSTLADELRAAVSDIEVEGLPEGATEDTPRAVLARAATAIDTLLGQISLDDVLMGGWKQLSELATALSDTAADGSTCHVALLRHTISSNHEPSVELVVNRVERTLMELEIQLRFEIAACEIVVEAGEVTGVEVGSFVAAGAVAAAGRSIVEHETDRLDPSRLFAERPRSAGAPPDVEHD